MEKRTQESFFTCKTNTSKHYRKIIDTMALSQDGFFKNTNPDNSTFNQIVRIIEHKDEQDTLEQKAREDILIDQLETQHEEQPIDKIPQTMVGAGSKMKYYQHYKKLDRILDQNSFHRLEESGYTALLQSSSGFEKLPLKYGIVKDQGKEECLTNNYYASGDDYYRIMLSGVKYTPKLVEYNIRQNRLTKQGGSKLLSQISYFAKSIDISHNPIQNQSIDALCKAVKAKKTQLQVLNLQASSIGDVAIQQLCKTFSKEGNIKCLNLGYNKLTKKSGTPLKLFIESNEHLRQLYLRWNKLGKGADQIFKGIVRNENIKVLDLSQCHISGFQHLAKMLSENVELFHLDLSSNSFSFEDVQKIVPALQKNHTIYGFHFEGNFGYIDPAGFLILEKGLKKKNVSSLHTKKPINGLHRNHKKPSESNKLMKNNCWICEGWQEKLFQFTPSINEQKYCLHASYNRYDGIPMKAKDNQTFQLLQMVPPGKTMYFYTHSDQNYINEKEYFIQRLDSWVIDDITISTNKKITLYVSQQNYCILCSKELFDRGGQVQTNVIPRFKEEVKLPPKKKIRAPSPWSFPKSMWYNNYRVENLDITLKCFERDFSQTKIPRLTEMKDPEVLMRVKTLLAGSYKHLKQTYRLYSCVNPVGDYFSISQNPFTDFCYAAKIIDKNMPLKTIDLKRIATLSSTQADWRGNPRNPEKNIVRYQFLELIVRIALQKYLASGTVKDGAEAVERMLTDIGPYIKSIDYQSWRESRYYNEGCDMLLKKFKPLLRHVYERYSVLKVKPSQPRFMCLDQFKNVCFKMELDKLEMVERDFVTCFNFGMQTQVDELEVDLFFKMNYLQFLEAFSRIVDQAIKGLPCQQSPKSMFSLNVKEQIRPLHQKLQFAIKNMLIKAVTAQFMKQYSSSYQLPDYP